MASEKINSLDNLEKGLGLQFANSEDVDYKNDTPSLEFQNPFLHHPKESKSHTEAEFSTNLPLRSLFPADYPFQREDMMTDSEIAVKLNEIKQVFSTNSIELGLVQDLPKRLLYTYIVEDVLQEIPCIPYGPDNRYTYVVDRCDGYCPGCFQRNFCNCSSVCQQET
jgi:hypothetical protein